MSEKARDALGEKLGDACDVLRFYARVVRLHREAQHLQRGIFCVVRLVRCLRPGARAGGVTPRRGVDRAQAPLRRCSFCRWLHNRTFELRVHQARSRERAVRCDACSKLHHFSGVVLRFFGARGVRRRNGSSSYSGCHRVDLRHLG